MDNERKAQALGQVAGTIKWFDRKKGFGFVKLEDGRDAFVHYSNVMDVDSNTLAEGQPVTASLYQGHRGLFLRKLQVT